MHPSSYYCYYHLPLSLEGGANDDIYSVWGLCTSYSHGQIISRARSAMNCDNKSPLHRAPFSIYKLHTSTHGMYSTSLYQYHARVQLEVISVLDAIISKSLLWYNCQVNN